MQKGCSLDYAGAPLFQPFLDAGWTLSVTERLLDLFRLCLLVREIRFDCFGVLKIVEDRAVNIAESDRREAVLDLLRRRALFEVVDHQIKEHARRPDPNRPVFPCLEGSR